MSDNTWRLRSPTDHDDVLELLEVGELMEVGVRRRGEVVVRVLVGSGDLLSAVLAVRALRLGKL